MNKSTTTRSMIEVDHRNPPQVYAPERALVTGENSDGSPFRIDIGRLCYLDRERATAHTRSGRTFKVLPVKIESLSPERVGWFRRYLNRALHAGWRGESLRGRIYYLQYFFNFCDFDTASKPTTLDGLVAEYRLFVNFLSQQGRMNGTSRLGSIAIHNRLKVARQFIQWACELQNIEMLSLIPVPRNGEYVVNPEKGGVSLESGQQFLQACSSYFNSFSDAILGNEYPILMSLSKDSGDKLYWYTTQFALKKVPPFLNENNELLTFQEVRPELMEIFDNKKSSAWRFYSEILVKNRNQWRSGALTYSKRYAFNQSCYCFFNLYLAVTGANIQPTLDLKLSDIDVDNIGHAPVANKHKFRAGRRVDFSAPSHFKLEFLKYLRLREWAARQGLVGGGEAYLFVAIGENKRLNRLPRKSYASSQKKSKLFDGIQPLSPKQLRQLAGEFFIRKSQGKISLAARKLNNSIATASKSYTGINLEVQAVEMNQFHEELAGKIRAFNRTTEQPIPVALCDSSNSQGIASGSCTNLGGDPPKRVVGYNELAPEPNCGTFETCLFCEHFAVHIDSEDIQKLLSMREALCLTSKIRNDPEHHEAVIEPALYRIDEIVEFTSLMSIRGGEAFAEAKDQIEMGLYNKHWGAIIQAIAAQKTVG